MARTATRILKPMRHAKLTARTVATLTKPGRHSDGGNLYLLITKTESGLSKRWVCMYTFAGKQREAGFGLASVVTLAEARSKAAEWRSMLAKGIDPLAAKRAAKQAACGRKTFGDCAADLIRSKRSGWRNKVHAGQWSTTIETYCGPILGLPVDAVDTQAVLSVLTPIWQTIPETASRLRGRIEAILDAAKVHGLRTGENPAAWRGHLKLTLPKPRPALSRGRHAAMDYHDVSKFVAELRTAETVTALALEFLILTACRSGEVLGATWTEIDLDTKVWIIPAARMKAAKEHRVPLSDRAVLILANLTAPGGSDVIFSGVRPDLLRRLCPAGVTVHGFRSSFRDWCGEETSFPREIAEHALAHATGSAVEQAYRRGDALEKRRALMDAWAAYVEPQQNATVVNILRGKNKA
jgi:integrase